MKIQSQTIQPKNASFWDPSHSYMRIVLSEVQIEANVGMHAWEQHPERPTRLLVNVEMFAHIKDKTLSSVAPVIDYDIISKTLKSWSSRPHVPLLETLVEEIIALCFDNNAVEACRVSIMKPDIFNNAAAAGVELYRVRPRSKNIG